MTDKRYVGLAYRSQDETLRELASGESDRVTEAILAAALHSCDAGWVVSASIALGVVPDRRIQRAAVLALAHVCVRFRSLPRDAVEQLLARLDLTDPVPAGAVGDLRDDMSTFLETQT